MLDQHTVVTILAQHFPGAPRHAIDDAAEDVLLLELLAADAGVVWEDAMRDEEAPAPATVYDRGRRRES